VLVDAERKFVQALAPAPEAPYQFGGAEQAQLRDRRHAQLRQVLLHHLADARQLRHRQRREEGFDLRRLDHELAVRLAPVAGDLRQELVRRDACRGGELRLFADGGANRARHRGGAGQLPACSR
jgi:hypothetical protein